MANAQGLIEFQVLNLQLHCNFFSNFSDFKWIFGFPRAGAGGGAGDLFGQLTFVVC